MGALAAVERFLERLFEGQSARLFRTRLRPIQVQRRLERTMESSRARDGGRTVVAHRFVVRLAPDDLTALRATSPALAASLADGALAFARAHGYTLLDRPSVTLRADARIPPGSVDVDLAAAPGAAPVVGDDISEGGVHDPAATPAAADAVPPTARSDATAVFSVPRADGPRATLREILPDRSTRSIEIDGRALTIGRAPDNGLVVPDRRASRHHARIDIRRGSLVLTDLGSTNGSWVNDRRVESVALGEGDRVRIGATTLVVESVDESRHHDAPGDATFRTDGRSTDGAASAG